MLGMSTGKLAPRAPGTWWPYQAVYAADFVADRYMIGGVEVPAGAAFSFSRASTKLAPDQAGLYHGFAVNELARTNRGALLEPASTNHIRNNTYVGAQVGTPTLPNNWSAITSAGLNREIVALGMTGSIPHMDLRIHGTANTAGPCQIACEAASVVAATPSDSWVVSAHMQIIDAPMPPLSFRIRLREDGTSGTNLAVRDSIISVTSILDRKSAIFSVLNSNTAYVRPLLAFGVTIGGTYDFTIRVAALGLETAIGLSSPISSSWRATTRATDELKLYLGPLSQTLSLTYENSVPPSFAANGPTQIGVGSETGSLRQAIAWNTG